MARTLEQLIANEKPELIARASKKADAMLLTIRLSEIRKLVNKTQVDLANSMGIKQPTVAGMEKTGADIKLSSLKKYIEACGAHLKVDIELPDGSHHQFSL
ncbi:MULTISPECIES: helix-turn-helix transcriptional regulator [Idiomarinaceae]|nr:MULTISPECIES: helix-turn-helix transcriptional regulator [Idiomarinaceae]MDT7525376.1 helix-turn-helix transcriptional regulator [Pseudidiomarina sp. GXY010]MRJ41283.1 helix-turn-helix domain-containing protein [Idiomarina sp. FeN1]NCU56448.1 helix-turn-helix domain-containing protein [Idiomarina sp. FenA--70]NCU59467.1 helix-turn-helix domain-containing protein [Idiomarina sp. FenBw--71]UUN12636.1 helix-turn-helix transcriptional regulator [Idiomarina loihiensis]